MPSRVESWLGAITLGIGASVLVGWLGRVEWLVHLPGAPPTQAWHAVALVCLGLGILWRDVWQGRALGAAAVGLAGAVAVGLVPALPLPFWPAPAPGFSPGAWAGLTVAGLALQCRRHPTLQALSGSVAAAIGGVVLLGYAGDVRLAQGWPLRFDAVSVRTALGLAAVGAAVVADGRRRAASPAGSAIVGLVAGLAVTGLYCGALVAEAQVAPRLVSVLGLVGVASSAVLAVALAQATRIEQARTELDALRACLRNAEADYRRHHAALGKSRVKAQRLQRLQAQRLPG